MYKKFHFNTVIFTLEDNIGSIMKYKQDQDEITEKYNSINEKNQYRFEHAYNEMDKVNDKFCVNMYTALRVKEIMYHP